MLLTFRGPPFPMFIAPDSESKDLVDLNGGDFNRCDLIVGGKFDRAHK